MSKIKKSYEYVTGAIRHPDLFLYYVNKVLKYRNFGLTDELLYWKHEMPKHPICWSMDMQTDIIIGLDHIEKNLGVTGNDILCLDLGSGPRSRLTAGFDAGLLGLVAVDPLAEEYIEEFGGRLFLQKGSGETLDKQFPPRSFHMVYTCNALDHVDHPPTVISNIKRVLKDDGVLVICGNIDNGNLSKWLGPHQHNLHIKDGELIWESKKMNTKGDYEILVNKDEFTNIFNKTINFTEDGNNIPWFFSIWVKK